MVCHFNFSAQPSIAAPPVTVTPVPTTPSPAPTQNSGPFACNFENGFCSWKQDHSDQFDWTIQSGSTSTQGTGPTGDHTQANHGKDIFNNLYFVLNSHKKIFQKFAF